MLNQMPYLLALSYVLCAAAQPAAPATPPRRPSAPVHSPEIHPDRTVTFQTRAPDAREVTVHGEWGGEALKLTRNEDGIWGGTSKPLASELWSYNFAADKVRIADPGNPHVNPM